jgi:hypothetical protein
MGGCELNVLEHVLYFWSLGVNAVKPSPKSIELSFSAFPNQNKGTVATPWHGR